MMLYKSLVIIHVISASMLFGTGIFTALYMLYANLLKDVSLITLATNRVIKADWLFTGITGVVQPLTGLWMLSLKHYSLTNPWVMGVFICYFVAMVCWFVVVYLQIKCGELAVEALDHHKELPQQYYRYFKIWVLLGIPAFMALIIVFYLMANNPFG